MSRTKLRETRASAHVSFVSRARSASETLNCCHPVQITKSANIPQNIRFTLLARLTSEIDSADKCPPYAANSPGIIARTTMFIANSVQSNPIQFPTCASPLVQRCY